VLDLELSSPLASLEDSQQFAPVQLLASFALKVRIVSPRFVTLTFLFLLILPIMKFPKHRSFLGYFQQVIFI